MYLNGHGLVQDDTQAVAWFTKSAANEAPEGQANLAYCHMNGWGGLERDVFEAGRLFHLAALQGNAFAQWELGKIHRKGELYCGIKNRLARKYMTLAADQGQPEAVARLEEMRLERLRCVFCGADALLECGGCHRVRYCSRECSIAHWRRGWRFQFPARGAAEEKHKHTCTRTYARSGE
jgi:TPR repeat protein